MYNFRVNFCNFFISDCATGRLHDEEAGLQKEKGGVEEEEGAGLVAQGGFKLLSDTLRQTKLRHDVDFTSVLQTILILSSPGLYNCN